VIRAFRLVAVTLFAVLLPLAVISSVVLGLVHDVGFYHDGQVRYEVSRSTGLSQDVHDQINAAILRFFDGSESLPDALRANGAPPDVYSEKEILHMNDVRDVIRAFVTLRSVSVGASVAFVLAGLVRWRAGGRQFLADSLVVSAIGTLVLGVVVGFITVVAFDQLFLLFHEVTFHNDFWELDPRTDHLIQMFPFEFWYDAMLLVAARVVLVTIATGAVGFGLGRLGRSVRRLA
jgi:integral membrane protein (TIGR01906 family)